MKKYFFLSSLLLFFSATLTAQAYEDDIQYDKKKQKAVAVEFAFPAEALENAFVERMKKMGYKPKEEKGIFNRDKGFLVFKNAHVTDISKDKLDYAIKVEPKSKKETEAAILYMIMLKDENNVLPTMSSSEIKKAKSFLNNLLPDVEAAHLELRIRDQENSLAKAEKKLRTLQAEKEDLDKKLELNLKTQDETVKEIESNKLALETLKGLRKKD